MLAKQATVIRRCSPRGKVRVNGEIWNALSIDGTSIDEGETVIVRDIEGTLLIVKPLTERQ
jgi:membrane protein implicated in regulation of membrane protease activity